MEEKIKKAILDMECYTTKENLESYGLDSVTAEAIYSAYQKAFADYCRMKSKYEKACVMFAEKLLEI